MSQHILSSSCAWPYGPIPTHEHPRTHARTLSHTHTRHSILGALIRYVSVPPFTLARTYRVYVRRAKGLICVAPRFPLAPAQGRQQAWREGAGVHRLRLRFGLLLRTTAHSACHKEARCVCVPRGVEPAHACHTVWCTPQCKCAMSASHGAHSLLLYTTQDHPKIHSRLCMHAHAFQ